MVDAMETRLHRSLAEEGPLPLAIYLNEGGNSEFAGSCERDVMVGWLCRLTHDLHFCLEVFFRATSLLDSFLSLMKVRHKFLQCVTVTCFYLAAKLEEDTETISSLLEVLVEGYGCECSSRDIQRMELIVMQKLEFHLTSITPLDFLKIFHEVGVSQGTLVLPEGLSPEQHLCHTTLCLEAIVSDHRLMTFRPSLLALAVLGCDLKLLGCDWLTTVVTLQTLAKIRGGELSVCYEAVAPYYSATAVHYPLAIATQPKERETPKCVAYQSSASGKGLHDGLSSPVKAPA